MKQALLSVVVFFLVGQISCRNKVTSDETVPPVLPPKQPVTTVNVPSTRPPTSPSTDAPTPKETTGGPTSPSATPSTQPPSSPSTDAPTPKETATPTQPPSSPSTDAPTPKETTARPTSPSATPSTQPPPSPSTDAPTPKETTARPTSPSTTPSTQPPTSKFTKAASTTTTSPEQPSTTTSTSTTGGSSSETVPTTAEATTTSFSKTSPSSTTYSTAQPSTTEATPETRATPPATEPSTTLPAKSNPNDVADNFFTYLYVNFMHLLDPFHVPDRSFDRKTPLLITAHYRFEKCQVFGLSSVARQDNFHEGQTGTEWIYVTGRAHFEDLTVTCTLKTKALSKTRVRTIKGTAGKGYINVAVKQNANTGKIFVTKFQLVDVGQIRFRVRQTGLDHLVTNHILTHLATLYQPYFKQFLQVQLNHIAEFVNSNSDDI